MWTENFWKKIFFYWWVVEKNSLLAEVEKIFYWRTVLDKRQPYNNNLFGGQQAAIV